MIDYDLPPHHYHAATDYLTSGRLRDFIRSPALYAIARKGHLPVKDSDALRFGTLFHLAILEWNKYQEQVAYKPEGLNLSTKEGKTWKEENAGKLIHSQADYSRVTGMMGTMPREVLAWLHAGKPEVTFRNELGGFKAQCRADSWNEKGNLLYDLKTISAIEKIETEIYKRGYHIQGRFYQRLMQIETGKLPTLRFIFAESAPPFRWRVVQLDVDYQMFADTAMDDALAEMAECERTGRWEDRDPLHLIASPPAWAGEDDDETEGEDE
jgi:hypothetical protein